MSEYTSTREGFQRAMKWSLVGPPEDARLYGEGIATPTFYHIMNGQRSAYDDWITSIAEWRAKIGNYEPIIHEFLRDGNQLAARMTGTIKVDGTDTVFESFLFGNVEQESGKLEWLIERSVWGPMGAEPEHGVN